MNNNIEKEIKIIAELLEVLLKHKATTQTYFRCVSALTMLIASRICAETHSEKQAHNIANVLRQLAIDIEEDAKQYANAELLTEE